MKDVIVFGGSGFLGSHVADALTNNGHKVTIYDIRESSYLKSEHSFIRGDILDRDKVEGAIRGRNVVYNFAGIADIDEATERPVETVTTNIIGNTNILEGCRKNGIKRYIFASTMYVYSNAGSFYRSSKQSCELIIENYHEKYGLDFTILRYGSLYGPRSNEKNSMYKFLKQALEEGKIVRLGNGEELRDYIHVYDAAQLSVKVLDEEFKNQNILLSGHQKIRIKDLLLMIREMLGNKIELEFRGHEVSNHHYNITPFEFSPKLAKKIIDHTHIDLGQGLLELLNILYISKQQEEGDQNLIFKK